MTLKLIHDAVLTLCADAAVCLYALKKLLWAEVTCHNDDSVFEIHGTSLWVSNSSVIKHLKQYVEYIRMGFFHLIKEYYWVWLTPYSLCELSTLIIAYISRRRSDESWHWVLLHVLTHIESDHVVFIIKQTCRKCLCKLCLTYTCRSEEHKRTYRLCRILDACLWSDDSLCHLCDSVILSYYPLVQLLIEVKCLITLTLRKLCNRYSCPARYNECNFLIAHILTHKR